MVTLSELRQAKQLTQKDLSQKTGIPTSSIAMYETGKRIPSLSRARTLGKFFNVSVEDIFFGNDTHETRAQLENGDTPL